MVTFTEAGKERHEEVREFIAKLQEANPETAQSVKEDWEERFRYLDGFGGKTDDGRDRFHVSLHRDWADLSFSVVWRKLNLQTGEYDYAFNGGLIWHGGPNDPMCVQIGTPTWWGIHT
jgi:hypothetical protein